MLVVDDHHFARADLDLTTVVARRQDGCMLRCVLVRRDLGQTPVNLGDGQAAEHLDERFGETDQHIHAAAAREAKRGFIRVITDAQFGLSCVDVDRTAE